MVQVSREIMLNFVTDPVGAPDEGGPQRVVTPLQVFTQVVTNEFDHKGRTLSMCRQLGYIPSDTDICL
jgi:uncharacterized damage-inducible protein DinB